MDCGCGNRQEIMGHKQWKYDAAAIGTAGILLVIVKGGKMSNGTRKLVGIALAGAVGALVLDGFVNPKLKP